MRILFVAGREVEYMRNTVLVRALRRFATVDVVAEQSGKQGHLLRSMRALRNLLNHRNQAYDLIVVGFYGYFILRAIGPFVKAPVLFDAFISNYDTLCFDRGTFRPNSPGGLLAFWLDDSTLRYARHILLDTPHHIDYFAETFDVARTRMSALPVGSREDLFFPRPPQTHAATETTTVLYYCTYMPLHGADVVIEAAARLHGLPIHFRLIGRGQTFDETVTLAQQYGLENVAFVEPVSYERLADEIAAADICLGGHFGQSDKAGRVVPGKIYQMLGMAKALIAADAPANRDLMTHGQHAWLVPPGDAAALADAVLALHDDPALRATLAAGGHALYQAHCSEAVIATQLASIIKQINHHP